MAYYFDSYENRLPPEPLKHSKSVETLWQIVATISLCLGLWYISWRWGYSLNQNALWFAIPLIFAETCAYFGLIIFVINLWKVKDLPISTPPILLSECVKYKNRL